MNVNAIAKVSQAVSTFRKLHEDGCFVIPNPWDKGSAKCLQHLGFKALATTSAGLAFSYGLPDTVTALSRDQVLEHIKEIAEATSLPVNADYQNGYAHEPEIVASNVALCIATGAAGLSIEDATGEDSFPLYERKLAIERIKAARAAIDQTQTGVVLTARCEAWLVGDPDAFHTAIDRLVAYADAGADCLFAPGVREAHEIEEIVRAVSPKPVNVLVSSAVPELSVERLASFGVRRISVGSALARVAFGGFLRAAEAINETGTFECLGNAASFAELNQIFSA
ncbi:MAG TPA: isocitrate lyase/phosphoenolpyruvate mutase family protein [Oculatellaceae cyanobacterium]